jgi:hypothetical protein
LRAQIARAIDRRHRKRNDGSTVDLNRKVPALPVGFFVLCTALSSAAYESCVPYNTVDLIPQQIETIERALANTHGLRQG